MDEGSPRYERLGTADIISLVALSALAVALGLAPLTSNDVWLHLATGDWILQHGRVPDLEVFSFVAGGRPYVAHEWGSQVLLSLVYRLGGLAGLLGFKTLVALLLGWLLHLTARRAGATPAAAAMAAGAALFVAGAHLWARPHLLTWLALMATLAILNSSRRQPWLLWLLIPLQALWTNLHGAFILGPAVAALWCMGVWLEDRVQRHARGHALQVAMAAAGMAAACLVNPYGWELVRFPFELTGTRVFMQAVYEWQPPLTSSYAGTSMFVLFALLVLVWGTSFLVRDWRENIPLNMVTLALLILALRMNRNVPLFMMVAAPAAAAAWSRYGRRVGSGTKAGYLAAAALGATALLVAVWGYPYSPGHLRPRGLGLGPKVPAAGCDTLERLQAAGHAFTTYGEGAYVVWRLWPSVQVSMDSRNSVYGEELYRAYRSALRDDAGFASYQQRWPVDLAVAAHMGPFRHGYLEDQDRDADLPHRGLLDTAGLVLVDFDDATAVYVRPEAGAAEKILAEAYQVIHPVLAWSRFTPQDLPRALAEARRAVRRRPDSVVAHWILANALAQSGLPVEALAELEALGSLDMERAARWWGVPHALGAARLGLMGAMHLQLNDCPAARQALEEALDLDPGYQPAAKLLEMIDC
jgi:tetratricopeptide (TPR) repeat protein